MTATRTNPTRRAVILWITHNPRKVVVGFIAILLAAMTQLPGLVKDTSADAFLSPDNPALLYKEKVREQFGLADPMVLAIENPGDPGIFRADVLQLVADLSEKVADLDNINANRVTSLATEINISSEGDELQLRPFFDPVPDTNTGAETLRAAIADFPLYQGNLVAEDGHLTLIVAEMVDEQAANQTYNALMALVSEADVPEGVSVHVAGEGAIAGYLGEYIDSDALLLNPLAGLIINLTIILAFFRLSPALMCNVIIGASVLITLATMAGMNIPFFVITNALPVILIGISVADSIHIYSEYYSRQAAAPEASVNELVVETIEEMWRPITLTTITTLCGFLGLYLAAFMPPFRYFGLFAALGVSIAWLYSLFFLPAAIALTKPVASPRFVAGLQRGHGDLASRWVAALGLFSLRHARATVLLGVAMGLAGLYAASQLVIDEDRIDLFHPSEAIYQADRLINRHMDGTNALDVVVAADRAEGLLEPASLEKIAALQVYAESLPEVGGSVSIVDYLKQMNRALHEGDPEAYELPTDREAVAQYFLIYSAMADPTDFEEEVDYDYRTANIRVSLRAGSYADIKAVVEPLQAYIDREFDSEELSAALSGRVNVNYHWFKDLGRSHFAGLATAIFLVWLVSAGLFRSPLAGLYALVPVGSAVLLVYAAMVVLGMTLGIGTSMFAAVAIGLGIDFSIHTLDRLRVLYARHGEDEESIYREFYLTTGRALFFNFLAIAAGFGVLVFSKIVSLNSFGSIVVLAVTTSFLASMTLLPALIKLQRPGFIVNPANQHSRGGAGLHSLALPLLMTLTVLGMTLLPQAARAQDQLSADEIVAQVNGVEDGEQMTRRIQMRLVDRHGKERLQETTSYRKYFGDEKRTVLFYEQPANVKGTAFLIRDYADPAQDDDQWLYLPVLRKAKRISAADRGDYFLGTDFTYEDMKLDGKMNPDDYVFQLLAEEILAGVPTYKIEAIPKNEALADELGYARTEFWVSKVNWMILKINFQDLKQRDLKSLAVDDIRQVDGLWTRHKLSLINHQTGHETHFTISDVDYETPIDDQLFTRTALSRGP